MTQLVQQVLDRRKELDEKTSAIRRKLQTYPDGKLICTRNGRYIKWYHSDGRIQTYIPKKKREYAEQLAEKKYWTLRLSELVREQKATEAYLRHYGTEKSSFYSDTSEQFLTDTSASGELLTGIQPDNSQTIQEWLNSPYQQNEKYPEQLIHKTAGGIYVRSKSESLIALLLHMHGIPFRYECELQLGEIAVYPDFTIMHPKTEKIYYWEHFGLIDDSSYVRSAMAKQQNYIANGIIPTIQLITTYETKANPLDTETVEKTIERYFK